MSLTVDDIQKMAHLARLHVPDQDCAALTQELSNILDLAHKMNAVDTSNIPPSMHLEGQYQRLRADQVTETDQHQLYQSIAPAVEAGLYLVPKVIESAE